MVRKCCIIQCKRKDIKLHRFPKHDEELCSEWLNRVGLETTIDNYRLSQLRICDNHFDDMCTLATRRGLKDNSLPIHRLPNCNLPATKENCFLQWTDDTVNTGDETAEQNVNEVDVIEWDHNYLQNGRNPIPEVPLISTPLQSSCEEYIEDEPSISVSDTIINKLLPESQLSVKTIQSSQTNYIQKEPLSVPFITRDPTISYQISYSTSNHESSIADETIDEPSTCQPAASLQSDYMVEINDEMSDDNIMDTIETHNINEAEEYFNIEEVCRFCLQKKETMSVIHESGIADMLLDCASIKVTPENGLYNLVCNQCSNNVSEWYKFKQQVVKSFKIGSALIENKQDFLKELCGDETIQNENCSDNIMPNTVDFSEDYSDLRECETNYEISGENSRKTKDTNKLLECRKTSPLLSDLLKRKRCDKVYNCISCNKKFDSLPEKSYSDEKPFRCDGCTKDSKTNSAVRIHISTMGKKSYQCQLCNQLFTTSNHLDIHMRKHSRQFPCPVKSCDKSFFEKKPMERHYSTIHFNVEHKNAKFPSPVKSCDKSVPDKDILEHNYSVIYSNVNVATTKCTSPTEFKVHMKTHTKKQSYECIICNKAFLSNANLNSHLRNHQ